MALMFDKSSVEEATHPLVRLLRLIIFKKKMSLDDFSALYAEHGRRLGHSTQVTNTNRNNARKAMSRPDDMTFRFFHYIALNILRLDIESISVVVRTESGDRIVISSTDPVE